jgi:acetyltransferase-like isoleucine patch superfamily enzyme
MIRRCNIYKYLKLPALLFLRLFFDRAYLVGRHYEDGLIGFTWALSAAWQRNILRLAPKLPFPASSRAWVTNGLNIEFHPDDLNNFQSPGIYFQNFKGKIFIGKGTYIAPNVGIITANHDPHDLKSHKEGRDVVIGCNCWIGMGSIILPGVIIGDKTIVGAGAVVTKSFIEGNCVVAGNPAKLVKKLI